jgi:hypothetical protein
VHEMETIRQVVTSKGWPTEHDAKLRTKETHNSAFTCTSFTYVLADLTRTLIRYFLRTRSNVLM